MFCENCAACFTAPVRMEFRDINIFPPSPVVFRCSESDWIQSWTKVISVVFDKTSKKLIAANDGALIAAFNKISRPFEITHKYTDSRRRYIRLGRDNSITFFFHPLFVRRANNSFIPGGRKRLGIFSRVMVFF
jgi:hypothetical protein